MLKIYDYLDEVLAVQHINQTRRHQKLEYYASDIMERIGSEISATEFADTLYRTFKICTAMDISINDNFKKIYCFDGKNMHTDWQMSPLGCYLLLLNGNPTNPSVAKVQLFAALHSKKMI